MSAFKWDIKGAIDSHNGINCDGCKKANFSGARYRCSTCPDYDLCSDCILRCSSLHQPDHLFLRIDTPIEPSSAPPQIANRENWVHNVQCDHCGCQKIIGYRFFCTVCAISFCATCDQKGVHRYDHNMLRICFPVQNVASKHAHQAVIHPYQTAPAPQIPQESLIIAATATLGQRMNHFGDNLWSLIIAKNSTNSSQFFSPLSIVSALLLAANGAADVTQTEILNATSVKANFDSKTAISAVNGEAFGMMSSLMRSGVVKIANSIWVLGSSGIKFSESYSNELRTYYGATAAVYNEVSEINMWCSAQTNGKIDEILPPGIDRPPLALVNAVYFKADWKHQFERHATATAGFRKIDGSVMNCRMMSQCNVFRYLKGEHFEAIRLPYESPGDLKFEAVIVLPAVGSGFDMLPKWDEIWSTVSAARNVNGTIELPQFKVESEYELKPLLQSLGMVKAFSNENMDFYPMVETYPAVGLQVSNVIHKVYVKVDEQGAEAAAVTAMVMGFGCAAPSPSEHFRMVCERPFSFTICESVTGTQLFRGHVMSPTPM